MLTKSDARPFGHSLPQKGLMYSIQLENPHIPPPHFKLAGR